MKKVESKLTADKQKKQADFILKNIIGLKPKGDNRMKGKKFKITEGEHAGKIIEILNVEIESSCFEKGFIFKIEYLFEGQKFCKWADVFEKLQLEELPAE